MNGIGTKLELKEIKGDHNFVTVVYEAAAWEGGRDGKYVTCPIKMFIRSSGQEIKTSIEFGERTRPTIEQSFNDLADQFEWMAKAIRERKPSINQIPLFAQ